MKDPDSKEEVEKRANQEDPIVMYLIVNQDLPMSLGKTCAQVGHAVQKLTLSYFDQKDISKFDPLNHLPEWFDTFEKWLDSSFRKVVLRAHQKEFDKLKQQLLEAKLQYAIVRDAGLTEIKPGSETVIGICPIYRSNCPKFIKKLQVLK